MMNAFKSLVNQAKHQWAGSKHRLDAFPDLATRLLTEFEYRWSQDQLEMELARWFLNAAELPEQVSDHNTFGQPPVTIFNNRRIAIELYFWLTCDTAIHTHGFRGAFRVLHGKSLQETYRMKVLQRIAPGVMRCDSGVPQMTLLEPGDVRTILPGHQLTHRVIHLEKPTVTLCVKTINEPGLYQWEHYPDGLAVQRRDLSPGLIKKIYYFDYLLARNAARAIPYLEKIVGGLSVLMRLTLYEALCGGAFDVSENAFEHCLSAIRAFHGSEAWFKRYESPMPRHLKELHFADCDSSQDRLAAHFINSGYDLETAAPHLSRLAGHDLSRSDAQAAVASLMDSEAIFGCDLSLEDRATIKALLTQLNLKIPRHLRSFGQIQGMRDFVQMFA